MQIAKEVRVETFRRRRTAFAGVLMLSLIGLVVSAAWATNTPQTQSDEPVVLSAEERRQPLAKDMLMHLPVKGRAAKTGYSRSEFGSGWASYDGCDVRNRVLAASLQNFKLADDGCIVLSGEIKDPYTGEDISFLRGRKTSDQVQIDHVVALSDAWQKGAQNLSFEDRVLFANDALNLLAVDGDANQQKGDSDAASWLPSNKSFRCQYIARQIAVKSEYNLWVTAAEQAAMERVLNGCGEQRLPLAA